MANVIPINQFAVVKNTEQNTIIDSGTYERCISVAETMNTNYQTDAFKAELWKDK